MLTIRQKELLEFIKGFIEKNAKSPTRHEIKQALNINSCAYLGRVLDKLENLKFIKRKAKRVQRNIELLHPSHSLPILGQIAAGSPIEVIDEPEEMVYLKQVVGKDRYLLRVKGNSMIEENICDGDLVICERCQKVPNGTIVVALINGQEATLKRIYYEKNKIRLKPANKDYAAQVYKSEEVEVQGKFMGLIRLA
ncbi:MAG: transcriptional repressor LexA [bacterium]